ncbi:Bug family tripartite tricarboxylate transporter substrate binding protein [Halobellus rufus]|uniref:Bug family tripartite tricarboxylate transporter substrate binding protein n=1 Tax=Halobellus rufus TaxID=1448860 RepID=UPI0006794E51|nr:tripartite tricarboxylate transporter substrate-binding protein [Halobellus rufus]
MVDHSRRCFVAKAGITGSALVGIAGCSGQNAGGGESSPADDSSDSPTDTEIEYPTEEISFIAPGSSGGGYDTYIRSAAPYFEEELGVSVKVENKPGGGGVLGANSAYKADADGYTLTMLNDVGLVAFDIADRFSGAPTDMSHVGLLTQPPAGIAVANSLEVDSWSDLAEQAPDITWATAGQGSQPHLGLVLLGELTGAFQSEDLNIVHYDSGADIVAGMERGEVGGSFLPLPAVMKVVLSLESVGLHSVLSDNEMVREYIEGAGVSGNLFLSDIDADNIERVSDLTKLGRFVTGPPGVPEGILEKQKDAFESVVNNDEFLGDLKEAKRPAFEPAVGSEVVNDRLDSIREEFTTDPLNTIIKDSFGG